MIKQIAKALASMANKKENKQNKKSSKPDSKKQKAASNDKKAVKKQDDKKNLKAAKSSLKSIKTSTKLVQVISKKDLKDSKAPKKDLKKDAASKKQEDVKKEQGKVVDQAKKASATEKLKKPKKAQQAKKKDEFELEEDLLDSDDFDSSGEEIPDLEEIEKEMAGDEEIPEVETPVAEEETPVVLKPQDEEIVLTDAEGRRLCRVKECDQAANVDSYCRYHYLLYWKKIQVRKKILADGKLERYVEELTSRYPDKFLEIIRKDLKTEKDFMSAIQELEIDESANVENEFEDETQTYIDEVRGLTETAVTEEEEF